MRRTVLIVSAGVLGLMLLAVALFGTALAQPTPGANAVAEQQGRQGQGSCHGDEGGEDVMLATLAKALGMSESQLATELESGKGIRDIAQSRGLDEQKLSAALSSAMQEEMKLHVQSGDLSQAEADEMLKHIDQMGANHLLDMIDGGMSADMADCEVMDDGTNGSANGATAPNGFAEPDMMGGSGASCHDEGTNTVF